MKFKYFFVPLVFISLLFSCKKDKEESYGKIQFNFKFQVNGTTLKTDTIMYTNAAGNPYMINNIQYFLTNIKLHNSNGGVFQLSKDGFSRYIDSDIPSTLSWLVSDEIPEGTYNAITFTFGIKSSQNKSNMFVNPPESGMWWPDMLGGGYHYMKLNGKWLPPSQTIGNPFNTHLGIGRVIDNNTSDTTFVDNSFEGTINTANLIINNETHILNFIMNIDSWFKTPNVYNFDIDGAAIMENQKAMQKIKENGFDVFRIEVLN